MSQTSSSSRSSHRGLTVQEVTTLISDAFPSKNLEVVNFSLKPFSSDKLGYLGVHELLTVESRARDGDVKSFTFFVKSVAPTCNDFDLMIFSEEANFFGKVVPRLLWDESEEFWAAKCYLARDDLMVLEDLRAEGFKVNSCLLQDCQLRGAMVSVARFHAASMLLEWKSREPLNKVYPGFFKEKVFLNDGGFAWKWLLAGIEVAEAVALKLGLEPKHASAAYHMMLESVKPSKDQRNVLCHGDLWSNNMLFKESEEDGTSCCKLVDFQLVGYACYTIDVMQLLHLNTNATTRKRLERELIQLYHSVLAENLRKGGLEENRIIGLEEIFRDTESKRICGIVAAVQYFPVALLNKELALEYCRDVNKLEEYMYSSRKDFVFRAMTLDENYRVRVEECVRELSEFMQNV
ncbi:uncharacterized protein LOC103316873 [Nasonia vitripennis]|uniref:CHK kinase-like domain-containing protein n=1 Tax=Nasonia vitripennis TaxID=7425 RepID=A0A7M7H813_NASVI|nr:uncharacterized protein LOC103316873 [Nasonia vitripennis]